MLWTASRGSRPKSRRGNRDGRSAFLGPPAPGDRDLPGMDLMPWNDHLMVGSDGSMDVHVTAVGYMMVKVTPGRLKELL